MGAMKELYTKLAELGEDTMIAYVDEKEVTVWSKELGMWGIRTIFNDGERAYLKDKVGETVREIICG